MKIAYFSLYSVLIAATCPAIAGGEMNVFKDSPVNRFNTDDLRLMNERIADALRADHEGDALSWSNEMTTASGSVTPLERLRWNQLSCRRLRIRNAYAKMSQDGVYKFCEQPTGNWRLIGPE